MPLIINCLVSFESKELRKYQKRWFLANCTWTKWTGVCHLMTVLHSYPWLVSWPSSAFGFFIFSTLLSPEAWDLLPSLKQHSCGAGACSLRGAIKLFAYPGVWDFFAFWNISPHSPVSAGLPSQAAVRGAERVQSFPTLQTLQQSPCPCSDWHLSLSGTQHEPSGCFNSTHRQDSNRKRIENSKVAKYIPFFPPYPLHACCTGVLLVCLPVYFCWETDTGLWDQDPVATGKCFTAAAFHEIPLRSPWLQNQHRLFAFPPSVCFHWLELALFQFLPFLGCQLMLVNTNNINASAFQPQLWKQILAPAELWFFNVSWLSMTPQNIPRTNAIPSSTCQVKIFHIFTYGEIFPQDLMYRNIYHPDTVFLAWV